MPNLDKIESIISNTILLKYELVDLGVELGISKSKLNGLNKLGIIESIKAVINHERSLDIIGKQAKQAGEDRNS
jgi:hypothetical protein